MTEQVIPSKMKETPLAAEVTQEISLLNERQTNAIAEIRSKLSKLVSQPEEESGNISDKPPMHLDFASEIRKHLSDLRRNTSLLENISNYMDRIV